MNLTTSKGYKMSPTTAEQTVSEKEAEKAALKAREAEIAAKEKEANKDKTGKGLRVFYGMTRGRNPQMIEYENWNEELKDSLPTTLSEFMDALKTRGVTDKDMENEVVKRLILGDNEILYKEASDPVAEFIESSWPKEFKAQFRLVVKNYATAAKVTIEDAVALLKPSIVAGLTKQ